MFITLVIEKWHLTFHSERSRRKDVGKATTKEWVLLVFIPYFTKESMNDCDVPKCVRSPVFIMQYLTTYVSTSHRQCCYKAFNVYLSRMVLLTLQRRTRLVQSLILCLKIFQNNAANTRWKILLGYGAVTGYRCFARHCSYVLDR
jgi:hypothetical protein